MNGEPEDYGLERIRDMIEAPNEKLSKAEFRTNWIREAVGLGKNRRMSSTKSKLVYLLFGGLDVLRKAWFLEVSNSEGPLLCSSA